MCHRWIFLLPVTVLSAAHLAKFATPPVLWGDVRVKHSWNTVPDNWERLGHPPAGTTIDLYFALKPQRESAVIDALHEVSDPEHEKYGAHLSKEEVAELVEPHQDTLELVHSWLERHGIPASSIARTHGGGWLTVTGVPASQADELLCASYRLYRHIRTNETILRTVGYSLPEALHSLVETVAPTTFFASSRPLKQAPRKRSSAKAAVMANTTSGEVVRLLSRDDGPVIVPNVLRWLYKTESYVPSAIGRNEVGILGFQNQYPSPLDLITFTSEHREDAIPATYGVKQLNGGGYNPFQPGPEANVDVQYSSALAYPAPHTFYSIGGRSQWFHNGLPDPGGDAYLVWLKYLLDQPTIPATIGISYANPEPTLPHIYAIVLCNLFAQVGLRGVSVIVATGDDGVGNGNCRDGYGNVHFNTAFPASCPWVTSVGGTTRIGPEVALEESGGGFSGYFPRPNYQDRAVITFLQNLGDQYAGLYNSRGRGVPDIAAQSDRFEFILGDEIFIISGTSCASPTITGIVSLLNDYRISTGRRPLGFLNFWLYNRGRAGLTDITSGNNPGCNTNGFYAGAGWDPVTGLGTPDFQRLQLVIDGLIMPID